MDFFPKTKQHTPSIVISICNCDIGHYYVQCDIMDTNIGESYSTWYECEALAARYRFYLFQNVSYNTIWSDSFLSFGLHAFQFHTVYGKNSKNVKFELYSLLARYALLSSKALYSICITYIYIFFFLPINKQVLLYKFCWFILISILYTSSEMLISNSSLWFRRKFIDFVFQAACFT